MRRKSEELTERIDFTPSVPYFIGFIIDFQAGTKFAIIKIDQKNDSES